MAEGGTGISGAGAGGARMVDIREMSFQNVIDQIFKPNGVKVGGFPDEMFKPELSEEERAEYMCHIWWVQYQLHAK